jgi:hypothetical protein
LILQKLAHTSKTVQEVRSKAFIGWLFSWHGFQAVTMAANPELGKRVAAFSAELEINTRIFETVVNWPGIQIDLVCNGQTAAACAAMVGNWKIFSELRRRGALLSHRSVVEKCAVNGHVHHLAQCLKECEPLMRSQRSGAVTEEQLKEIFDATCDAGEIECARHLYHFASRHGWEMMTNPQLLTAVGRRQHWMVCTYHSRPSAAPSASMRLPWAESVECRSISS